MAQKKKLNRKKALAKKSGRKITLKAKAHSTKSVATKRKQAKPLPITKPVVVVAIEAEAKRSPASAWAGMPFAIMNMWLAPFERRT